VKRLNLIDRRTRGTPKKYEALVECLSCRRKWWAPYSNYVQNKTGLCKQCFKKSREHPLGVKWKGRLTPMAVIGTREGHMVYRFRCDCGKEFEDTAHNSRQSCGCLYREARLHRRHPDHSIAFNRLWHQYRHSKSGMSYQFTLSKDQFKTLVSRECYYCGQQPKTRVYKSPRRRPVEAQFNGIDRLDSTNGYTEENTVPCCTTCNAAKSNRTQSEFLEWARRIANRHP